MFFKTNSSNSVNYDGLSHPNIGVEQDQSLTEVIGILASTVSELKDKVDQMVEEASSNAASSTVMVPNPRSLGTVSTTAANTARSVPFNYNVVKTDSSYVFSYNLDEYESQLPRGYRLKSAQVKASGATNGRTVTLLSSDQKVGGFSASPNQLPADVSVSMRLDTPSGEVALSRVVTLNGAESGAYAAKFDARDFSAPEEQVSVEESTSILAQELSAIKSEMNNFKSMNIPSSASGLDLSNVDIVQALTKLSGAISVLESKIGE